MKENKERFNLSKIEKAKETINLMNRAYEIRSQPKK